MKLSKYIEGLQAFLAEYGDLECYYVSDDEGNSYQQVNNSGTLFYTDEPNIYRPELYYVKDLPEMELKMEDVTPVCVVN